MQYIVNRHPGAIRWLRSKGYYGEVIHQWTDTDTARIGPGDLVVGVLPVLIIAQIRDQGAEFHLLALPAIAFSQRGQELTPEEMDQAGARVYRITRLELEEI